MRIIIHGIIIVSLTVCACSQVQKLSNTSTGIIENDSIQKQQFIDSLLTTVAWENSQSHLGYLGLNGHIDKVEYSTTGNCLFLPFETINFDGDGMIMSVFDGESVYHIYKDNKLSKIICLNNGFSCWLEFNMVRKDQKSIFEMGDEYGRTRFTFIRNSNNEISELEIYGFECLDMDSDEYEEYYKKFNAKVDSYDSHNNWTSITLQGEYGDSTIKRKITYIDEPSCVKYFETESGDKILCKFPSEYGFRLAIYDCNTEQWQWVIPYDYADAGFGYKDMRIVGDKLYLIFNTGNNWIGAVCGIYLYDIATGKITELDMGGEDCKFVDDRIKVYNYEIIDYGDCTANSTYKEIITWIDMK